MLQTIVIGNVGADAQVKNKDGREFTTWRVAHNDTWRDAAGVEHSNVVWVDCIMNGRPNVAEYIKAGTQVVVMGNTQLRVYSSQKDRCMKAGLQINVTQVQLLGGSTDAVPRRLYDEHGVLHDVQKFYLTDVKGAQLMSQRGAVFTTDSNGWVTPVANGSESTSANGNNDESQQNADGSPAEVY